jgi:hypothetical protein
MISMAFRVFKFSNSKSENQIEDNGPILRGFIEPPDLFSSPWQTARAGEATDLFS